ncbi:glutathione peroxidase [Acidithiobacillus sp.]|jgi:glutathione peroxidase|uniref:glutathione peroxidase n=1 Tax=Acidithiobacillus sp. TaxID=1872118 RepID=UPI0025C3C0D2|nr:glutathione peroxidase [Acidithiobacillus sp.]
MPESAQLYDYCLPLLDGREQCLRDFAGQVLLIVNTASLCGFTPQYAGLQKLYQTYGSRGFSVLAFPCNQFAHQEPGSAEAIGDTCHGRFAVTFPVFAKVEVNGPGATPLFQYLKSALPGWFGPRITWNFTKFLVDRQGRPHRRFAPRVAPEKIAPAVEELLRRPA